MSERIAVQVEGACLWRQAIKRLMATLPEVQVIEDNAPWRTEQVTVLVSLCSPEVQDYLRKQGAARCVLVTNDQEMRKPSFRDIEVSVFVGDQEDAEILNQALRQAADNRSFCSQSLLTTLISVAQHHGAAVPTNPVILSSREQEVVGYALQGWSNEQISAHLHISLSTVKFHLFNTYRKLGVSRRAQLRGALARQHDLLQGQTNAKL